jgi:origin recognition complex subunit 6
MPAIRSLVKQFDLTSAAPHIFTGIESILPLLARMSAAAAETPSKRPQRTTAASHTSSVAVTDTRTMALVVVVFLYVFTKMKDVDVTPDVYEEWRKTAVNTLLELPVAKQVAHDELSLDIQELMPMAQAEGWLQMEWFLNVEPMEDVGAMEGVEHTGNVSRSGAAKSIVAKSGGSDYIGLGTMMQDATDYLGERQRQNFETWKAHIMARVQEVETA